MYCINTLIVFYVPNIIKVDCVPNELDIVYKLY